MIEESLDSAADTLWEELGPAAVGALERQAGLTATTPATDGVWARRRPRRSTGWTW